MAWISQSSQTGIRYQVLQTSFLEITKTKNNNYKDILYEDIFFDKKFFHDTLSNMAVYMFYGKSGSGKGTQAQILKSQLESQGKKIIYIETGKLFRDFIESHDNFMGNHVRSVVESGNLMPSFFPIYLWSRELVEQYTGVEDVILDGTARRIEEAPIIHSAFDFLGIQERYVITLTVSNQWVFDHMGFRDRADDTQEGMQQRLQWFDDQVVPVIDFFKQESIYTLMNINGEQTIEQVAQEISNSLT